MIPWGPIAFFGALAAIVLAIKASRYSVRRQMEAYGRVEEMEETRRSADAKPDLLVREEWYNSSRELSTDLKGWTDDEKKLN